MNPDRIIEIVSKVSGVSCEEIKSPSRFDKVVKARDMAVLICFKNTNLSLWKIGKYFGNRHHTTVMTSRNRAWELMDSNYYFVKIFKQCNMILNEPAEEREITTEDIVAPF